MAELRYDTETWKSRPTKAVWDKLKKWVSYPAGTTDKTLPPMFGWCVDQLRDNYGIYISVIPHRMTKVNDSDGTIVSSLSFHFGGTMIVMKNLGKITEEVRWTGQEFPDVMNSCLEGAVKYIETL